MDDLVNRKKVLDAIYEWIVRDEINHPDAFKLLGDRIRELPSENMNPE